MFKRAQKEEGQGLVEYALILVLVAIVVIVILTILGGAVNSVFARVMAGMNGQALTGQGTEAVVSGYDSSVSKSFGTCAVTMTDVSIIVMVDGSILEDGSAQIPVTVNGGSPSTLSVSTNGSGVAQVASMSYSGSCPLKLNVGGSPLTFN